MQAFLVQRKLKLSNDTQVTLPVRVLAHKRDAEQFAKEVQRGMADMLRCQCMGMTPDGKVVDTGISVMGFLGDLGLVAFTHDVMQVEVKGSIIEAPREELVKLQ